MTGAQFRNRKDFAMEAARLIKSKNPHSMVEVKDLKSGRYRRGPQAGVSNATQARPDRPHAGIDKHRPDYTIYSGGWAVGRIYETRGGPDRLRWFWSLTVNGPMTRSDRVASLEEAKARCRKSWDAWKAWAKQEEVPQIPLTKVTAIVGRAFRRPASLPPCHDSIPARTV